MSALLIIGLIMLSVAPLFVAFLYGDKILDSLSRRTRKRRKSARRRRTRALPIRKDEIERLLRAEEQRDLLDESIAADLEAFARVPGSPSHAESESEIEAIERAVLDKESQFGVYLDYAWLQSETLEVLSREARLLRQLADLPEDGLPVPSPDRTSPAVSTPRQKTSTENLFESLRQAQERKATVDRKLRSVGSTFEARPDETDMIDPETEQDVRRPDGSKPRLGGAFDATIGDDSTDEPSV